MKRVLIFFGLIILLTCVFSIDISSIPAPTNYLSDYSGALSSGQISQLNSQLKSISDDSNIQIGVWFIDSTGNMDISDYTLQLGNKFGVGNKGRYDGIVILVAVKDHAYFISTAKGAETMLTDIQVHDIETKDFDPNFSTGDYYTGLSSAITDLNSAASISDSPLPSKINIGGIDVDEGTLIFIMVIAVICIVFLLGSGGFGGAFLFRGLLGGGGSSGGSGFSFGGSGNSFGGGGAGGKF